MGPSLAARLPSSLQAWAVPRQEESSPRKPCPHPAGSQRGSTSASANHVGSKQQRRRVDTDTVPASGWHLGGHAMRSQLVVPAHITVLVVDTVATKKAPDPSPTPKVWSGPTVDLTFVSFQVRLLKSCAALRAVSNSLLFISHLVYRIA